MIPTLDIARFALERHRLAIRGAVQGVGFRPFAYRLARELRLTGWVNNSPQGVFIEIEGTPRDLAVFRARLESEKPAQCFFQSFESSVLDAVGYSSFEIRESEQSGQRTVIVLPDIATCPDCTREIFDPLDRRYHYSFTNCTNCGPRFSIINSLPYDREHTTMRSFAMCPECSHEYYDPANRRFHAQPNACPVCGPELALWDRDGIAVSSGHLALEAAAEAVRQGEILALKGLGGFQLLVDAGSTAAVRELRHRKHRDEKPFALMFPSLEFAANVCEISTIERRLLLGPEAPITLLRRKPGHENVISDLVAPGNPWLGVMLPYTPLHHLLMAELGFPIVATSGNLSDEPICIDEAEAVHRLSPLADIYLVHDRPIARHVDDSVVRVMLDREMVLRRARGYAPLPIMLSDNGATALAVGAHMKNAIGASIGSDAFLSQHIGDLETLEATNAFSEVIGSFGRLYDLRVEAVACDLHPDYFSTRFAREMQLPLVGVQHHFAHILSCMAENHIEAPVLGIAWDGTGYGEDGTIWGGEFLRVGANSFERVAHVRQFRLAGGDRAVMEPVRSALGLLYAMKGEGTLDQNDLTEWCTLTNQELQLIETMLEKELNSPLTSSAGRLFDAVAALIGVRERSRFEGQAAMELEFLAQGVSTNAHYGFDYLPPLTRGSPGILDWAPLVEAILRDRKRAVPSAIIAAKFHNALVEAMVEVCKDVGEQRIALSGGCFQNRVLTESAVKRLREGGFRVYWHQRVPPNDGGIALGQLAAARRIFSGTDRNVARKGV